MATKNPNKFYAERGLIRKSYTVSPETSEFISSLAEEHENITQGDILHLFTKLMKEDDNFAERFKGIIVDYERIKPPKKLTGRPRKEV